MIGTVVLLYANSGARVDFVGLGEMSRAEGLLLGDQYLIRPRACLGRHGRTDVYISSGKISFSINFIRLNLPGVFFQVSSML